MPCGKEDIPWAKIAVILVICRLCNPSSELHIAEHYYKSTALPELLGVPVDKVNHHRLHRRRTAKSKMGGRSWADE